MHPVTQRAQGVLAAFVILLGLGTCGAQTFVPGQSYFGRSNYIEYIAGDLPFIISAPHGGTLTPAELPDRTYGTFSTDGNTDLLARDVRKAMTNRLGHFPHVIICNLDRNKIDCNREIVEGAQSNALTEISWNDFQNFIGIAKQTVSNQFGRGLYIDLHGHGHPVQRLELGYLLSSGQLGLSDATLNGSSFYPNQSSLRELNTRSPATFAQLLRGTNSLGGLLSTQGYPAVPSPTDPDPGTNAYFNGGYNTDQHGSINGGTISGLQIECNSTNVRDTAAHRLAFATNLCIALEVYFSNHFSMNLGDDLPTISAISNRVINEDGSTSTINFTIGDTETAATNLGLAKYSSDTNIVPLSGIVLGGSGSNRTVKVFPATNRFGVVQIGLAVTDANGGTTSNSFQVTVNPVNDPPALAAISNRTINAGETLVVTNTVTDADLADTHTFSLLLAPSNATIGTNSGILSWRAPVAQANSNHAFQVRVADNGSNTLSATQAFSVFVNPLAKATLTPLAVTNNSLQLLVNGAPGPDYTVQATTNFNTWTNLLVTNSPTLPLNWTDTNAGSFLKRFYRVLLGP